MDRLRMRTTLLIPLLILSFGCTVLSLLVIRTIVQQQTQANLASDLQHSVKTYRNFQHQQRELLTQPPNRSPVGGFRHERIQSEPAVAQKKFMAL